MMFKCNEKINDADCQFLMVGGTFGCAMSGGIAGCSGAAIFEAGLISLIGCGSSVLCCLGLMAARDAYISRDHNHSAEITALIPDEISLPSVLELR